MAIEQRLQRLLQECIETPRQLDLLSAMAADPARSWNAEAVAAEFGIDDARAREDLEALCSRNLLAVGIANSVWYKFAPGNAGLVQDIQELLAQYRQRPAAFAGLLVEQARTRQLRDFADAFRLRKKQDHG